MEIQREAIDTKCEEQYGQHIWLLYTGQLEKRSLGPAIFQDGVIDLLVKQRTFDPFLEDSECPFSF